MVKYMNGNLLESGCDYICHQVNCQGKMGSGIAKQIRDKWPIVYEQYIIGYEELKDDILRNCGSFEFAPDVSEVLLGRMQIVPIENDKSVVNMFSQQYYGYDGKRYTSYDAFVNCLDQIRRAVPHDKRIGFPYNIGCDRGGASWNIISAMIEEILKDHTVEIWRLYND